MLFTQLPVSDGTVVATCDHQRVWDVSHAHHNDVQYLPDRFYRHRCFRGQDCYDVHKSQTNA